MLTSMRIDKWLWAARFFKTRALAAKACDLGRIRSATEAKPARDVHVGDMLHIKNEGGDFEVEVLGLSEMRGPATVAQTLYRETDASKEAPARPPRSARPCSNSRRCPSAAPANATAAASSSFAADGSVSSDVSARSSRHYLDRSTCAPR